MSIIYKCRHCGHIIGELKQQEVDVSALGWDRLTPEDKQEMIQYQENGEIHLQVICENCQESLGRHPQYHELDFFIQ